MTTGPETELRPSWRREINETVEISFDGTAAELAQRVIPDTFDVLRSNGLNTPGDGGDALYKRVSSPPSDGFQSADGAYWERVIGGGASAAFASRAAAQAAKVPPQVQTIAVLSAQGQLLTYVRDSIGTALVTADGAKWSPAGGCSADLLPDYWGAVTAHSLGAADSVADSYDAVTAMLAWCVAKNYTGKVHLGAGYYALSQTVEVPSRFRLIGKGAAETNLHARHLSGPVIRFMDGHSGLEDCGITASAERRAGTNDGTSVNFGILCEATDLPEADAARLHHMRFASLRIVQQPGNGIHIVGPAFTGEISDVSIQQCKGHGIAGDRGQQTGRTNLVGNFAALCTINDTRIGQCTGHMIACGRSDDAAPTQTLRWVVNNMEGNCTYDANIMFASAAIYLRGANFAVNDSAPSFGGTASIWVEGRNIHIKNLRSLGSPSHSVVVSSYDGLTTDGVFIDGINVIGSGANQDPAILVTKPSGQTTEPTGIWVRGVGASRVASVIKTDSTMGSGPATRVPGLMLDGAPPVAWKAAGTTRNNTSTPAEDPDLRIWLAAGETVAFTAMIQFIGNAGGDLRVRMNAPAGASVTYGTPDSVKVGDAETIIAQSAVTSGPLIFGAVNASRNVTISGHCTNGQTAGWLGVYWAQATAHASDLTVEAGSHMIVRRIRA